MIKTHHPDPEKGTRACIKVTRAYGFVICWASEHAGSGEPACILLTHRRFRHGNLRFFLGGVTDNRHLEACDVIEILTKVKKFCPVENRHEMGRENQDSSGALRNAQPQLF